MNVEQLVAHYQRGELPLKPYSTAEENSLLFAGET